MLAVVQRARTGARVRLQDPVRVQVDAFVDALRLFKIGYSWAGPLSLVVPYDLRAMRGDKAYPGTLVRFSIGLEAAADLCADVEQALAKAFG